jgi:hypothetical protein
MLQPELLHHLATALVMLKMRVVRVTLVVHPHAHPLQLCHSTDQRAP